MTIRAVSVGAADGGRLPQEAEEAIRLLAAHLVVGRIADHPVGPALAGASTDDGRNDAPGHVPGRPPGPVVDHAPGVAARTLGNVPGHTPGQVSDPSPDRGAGGPWAFALVASEVGIARPDRRVFTMAAAAAGCHPAELVHVGPDPRRDVAAAQAAGCRAIWWNAAGAPCPPGIDPDATIAELAELPSVIDRFDHHEEATTGAIGVGPHPEPWPHDPRLDPALLAAGDRRNVVDRYRYWREEEIVADLDGRRHPFHVAVENWRHDRNIGAVVRNANAFGAAAVHIVGRRRWNRRGAMATDRYLTVHHHDTIDDLLAWAEGAGLVVVGIDNVEGSVPLESAALPERCVLLFGQEGPGLSPAAVAAATVVCAIAQFGSTRSVNAGVASGIAMYAWIDRHGAGVTGAGSHVDGDGP